MKDKKEAAPEVSVQEQLDIFNQCVNILNNRDYVSDIIIKLNYIG